MIGPNGGSRDVAVSDAPGAASIARRSRARRMVTLAVAFAGVAVWIGAGAGAGRLRKAEEDRNLVAGRRSEGEAIASALGGFRGLVSDFLWLRAIQMRDEGRFDEITLLCRLILDVQPRFTGVWQFMSWNLSYNLAYDTSTPGERWRWIQMGMDILADEKDGGIVRNPGAWEIYEELGHTYYFRVSRKGSDPFYRHYQERLAPVPEWCGGEFDFVDQGLWGVAPVEGRAVPDRYRLYRKDFAPGPVRLGSASGGGGYPTRARRMYVVIVSPAGALARASVTSGRGPVTVRPARFGPGARLYSDAPMRVAATRFPPVHAADADEGPFPDALSGAAVIPLPDADRTLETEEYLELELSGEATVWVGWPADETRNFELARKWLKDAERLSHGRFLRVSRLRIYCLVDMGKWDEAHEEFRELLRSRPKRDTSVPNAFRSFLLYAVYRSFVSQDQEGIRKWHGRLRAEFPAWTMPPAETAEYVARTLGVPLPHGTREE
ncbi:MAG: hypothetical protein ACYTKD_26910 [Planctomycetota bacterium]